MQYAILVYESPDDQAGREDDERFAAYMGAHLAYYRALCDAGVYRGGAGLQGPGAATSLRIRGERRQVQDGPFIESKEQIGGMYVIETTDLDMALAWASRCPTAATGGVEIRPLLAPPPGHDPALPSCAEVPATATTATTA